MPEYVVEWTIKGTTKVTAATPQEAEERPRHMGFDELMLVPGTGIPTVFSFETRVQGGAPKEIRVYRDGDAWCALVGGNLQSGIAEFGASPEAAVRYLVEKHPEALE